MEKEKELYYIGVNYVKDFYKMSNHFISNVIPAGVKRIIVYKEVWEFAFTCEIHNKGEAIAKESPVVKKTIFVTVDANTKAVTGFTSELL